MQPHSSKPREEAPKLATKATSTKATAESRKSGGARKSGGGRTSGVLSSSEQQALTSAADTAAEQPDQTAEV